MPRAVPGRTSLRVVALRRLTQNPRRMGGDRVVVRAWASYPGIDTPTGVVRLDVYTWFRHPLGVIRQRCAGGGKMPLSEHEQRLLRPDRARALCRGPQFASAVRGTSMPPPHAPSTCAGIASSSWASPCRARCRGPGAFLHIAEIPWLSVLGFLVMFGGVLLAVTALGASGEVVDPAPQGRGGHGGRGGAPAKSSFTERMEERFRRRFEDR